MKVIVQFLTIGILLIGCEKKNEPASSLDQVVLFQSDYINYAWVYQHQGSLLDRSGNVRGYKLPKIWHFPDAEGYISVSDMNENIEQLDPPSFAIQNDTLKKYFDKLKIAANGILTIPVNVMADAGTWSYSGFIFDSKTRKYRQVLIRQEGDFYIENKSKEAKEIYNWFKRHFSK